MESRWTLSGVEGVRGASEWTCEGGGVGISEGYVHSTGIVNIIMRSLPTSV